jgi:adenylate cyclase, class 2
VTHGTRLVELKARCDDPNGVRSRLAERAIREAVLDQVDTYFVVPSGRLKLRQRPGQPDQLIAYERADVADVKHAHVQVAPVEDGAAVGRVLAQALGVRARVVKRREIWRWEGVQVHLDRVDELGDFLEFEAIVATPEAADAAEPHLRRLLAELSIPSEALVARSYGDLVITAVGSL